MRFVTRLSAAALLPLVAGVAFTSAAQAKNCDMAVTQSEMNACAYDAWQVEDARLNQAYKEAMAMLRAWDANLSKELAGGPDRLKEAQRAWIIYRDKGCEAEGFPMRGGSAEPLLVYGCMTRVTKERADALENLLEYKDHM